MLVDMDSILSAVCTVDLYFVLFNHMVEYSQANLERSMSNMQIDDSLDRIFHALSDPTRRSIVRRLTEGPANVTTLAEPFPMSLNAVSKHLKTLEGAGLIHKNVSGRTSVCSLNEDSLLDAHAWLNHYVRFWEGSLESLAHHMKGVTGSQNE